MSATHQRLVKAWLTRLAATCAGSLPPDEVRNRVDLMAEDLAHDFPDAAVFSDDSRRGVAAELQSFPTYGRLKAFLGAWWDQHRPTAPTPGEPAELEATDLPVVDRFMLGKWLSVAAMPGNRKVVGDWVAQPWADNAVGAAVQGQVPALVVDLSLIRRHATAGYRHLLRTSQLAAQVASKMGWTDIEHRRAAPTEDELAAVAERVGSLTNGVGHRIDDGGPRAPNTNHQAAAGRYAAQVEAQRGRKIGQLSPEQLNAAWDASKTVRPQVPPKQEAAE
jgi:hypothetical protein